MLSSNPAALPPEAGDPPRGQTVRVSTIMCWVYQPGEKSETYHRDDLRHEQSVHAGGRRGCECTRFSLSIDSCTDKIALNDSASPSFCFNMWAIYFFKDNLLNSFQILWQNISITKVCTSLLQEAWVLPLQGNWSRWQTRRGCSQGDWRATEKVCVPFDSAEYVVF